MNLVRPDLISQPAKGQVLKPGCRGRADWSGFENSSFEFGACFGFRVSDFGFVLAGQRRPLKGSVSEKSAMRSRLTLLALAVCLAVLLAGCLSPRKKVAARLPGLRSQWTTNVVHQTALPEQAINWASAVSLLRTQNLKLLAG